MLYRVHFADGTKIDVSAEDTNAARRIAHQKRPEGKAAKIKLVREMPVLQDIASGIAMLAFLIGGGMVLAGVA
jgi:hypothetical protein